MKEKLGQFVVLPNGRNPPRSARCQPFLLTDNWDDWFKYSTVYVLIVVDEAGAQHSIGSVKIGQTKMKKEQRRPDLPEQFDALGDKFFSLGQDDSYYENLNRLGDQWRDQILSGLRDVARDLSLFELVRNEDVTGTSLLRNVSVESVQGQFHRMAIGGARLSNYSFKFTAPRQVASSSKPAELTFDVSPESRPPTNIQVIIGRNGVGKTYLLDKMTRALVEPGASVKKVGEFSFKKKINDPFFGESEVEQKFANLVSVSFSAFDSFEPLAEVRNKSDRMLYAYVGLKRFKDSSDKIGPPKSPLMLAREFVQSVRACSVGARLNRWRRALDLLNADPIFKDAEVAELAKDVRSEEFDAEARKLFDKLSSGHKIVLLTITRLVETVQERSLVLLDEPEAHLHPPLLSALIRSLSDLLIDRNGVAIIATHSPVILQEVPKSCVWKLNRSGHEVRADRPEIETFGENVGILTREVFQFEVTHSGFHRLLQDSVNEGLSYEDAVEKFDEQLGAEARAILRGMIAERDAQARE